MTPPKPSRDGADRCPGLLAPFVSADGAMVRLRLPGGRVSATTLVEISSLATRFGDPRITVTSRGSLQLRGLANPLPGELIGAIGDLGLIPSAAHDKARNIVADPGNDLDDLVAALDDGLLAQPDLAGLPGRFLLAVAGPGGPVLAEPWDVAVVDDTLAGARRGSPDGTVRVIVDGQAERVARGEAPALALEVARRFLAARPGPTTWNVRDLPLPARQGLLPGSAPCTVEADAAPVPGPLGEDLVALIPLGLLTPTMVAALAPAGHLTFTPWRSVLVPGGARRAKDLAAAGLVTAPDSPWTVLTACAGAPQCARTTTPTRDLARAASGSIDPAGPPVHVIGCERACGHPARAHVTSLNPTSAADIVAAQDSSTTTPTRKAP